MMNRRTDIPEEIYQDEVVLFLADRYHTTPREVLQCFLVQDGICLEQENEPITFRLEDNEMAMLHDMIIKMKK